MAGLPDPIRRRMLLTAGAATVLAPAALPGVASAAPGDPEGPTATGGGDDGGGMMRALALPPPASIVSARRNGYVYRTLGPWDFSPEGGESRRAFGGAGVYTTGAATWLWAGLDLPAGATLRDVEVYAYNSSGVAVVADVWMWSAGSGYLGPRMATMSIPSQSQMVAVRAEFTADNAGPLPNGSKIFLGMRTPISGQVQINGARFGLSGGSTFQPLESIRRIYTSATNSGKLRVGEARLLTVPASVLPPGAVAMHANFTVYATERYGFFKVWPSYQPEPTASVLRYKAGDEVANAVPVGLSVLGGFRMKASSPVQVIVDIMGFYS